jgi:hypothetical protein
VFDNFFHSDPPSAEDLESLVLDTIIGNARSDSSWGDDVAKVAGALIEALHFQAESEERELFCFDTIDEGWAFYRKVYVAAAKRAGIERDEEAASWPDELPWSKRVPRSVIAAVARAEASYEAALTRELRRMHLARKGAA